MSCDHVGHATGALLGSPALPEAYRPCALTAASASKYSPAAEGITTVKTWSPIRDEALKKPPPTGYPRSDLKPARTSSEKSCGCSQAAKCPPLASALKWMRLW